MFALITTVASFVFLYILIFYWRIAQAHWVRQFPGSPLILPVVGNAWELAGHPKRLVDFCTRNFKKHGLTWRVWILSRPSIITADPSIIKAVIGGSAHLEKHFVYHNALEGVLGKHSIIFSKAEQWRKDRKTLNRTFNFAFFESLAKSTVNVWPITRSKIMSSNGKPLDAFDLFKYIVVHYVIQSMHVDESYFDASVIPLAKQEIDTEPVGSFFEISRDGIAKPWAENPFYWRLFGYANKVQRIRKTVTMILEQFEKEYAARIDTENALDGDCKQSTAENTAHKNLMGVFGDKSIPLDWRIANFSSLLGGAVETSSLTITMTLFFLAVNPHCLKRAQEEVDSAFHSPSELQKANLKYLKMCIKESMRLHAPLSLFGRRTESSITLDDGRKIPEGAHIGIIPSVVHLNPDHFSDPLKFDPERFNEVNVSKIKPFTYIPFSMGPRNCIGQKFSEINIPLTIAPVLKYFSITTLQKAEDIGIVYGISGLPTPSVQLIFTPRGEVGN